MVSKAKKINKAKKEGNKMKSYIKLIEQFEKENRFYWIKALKVSNTVKGKLIIHFSING